MKRRKHKSHNAMEEDRNVGSEKQSEREGENKAWNRKQRRRKSQIMVGSQGTRPSHSGEKGSTESCSSMVTTTVGPVAGHAPTSLGGGTQF